MPVPSEPSDLTALDVLAAASQRLVRSVDELDGPALRAPSGLPGWTRAHVVAHLALNAEGMAGALAGLVAGEPVAMYASPEARDADIEELAGADPAELRDRLLGSITVLADALVAVPADLQQAELERTPGGRTYTPAVVPGMRLGEVEIHHVDLATSYSWTDWPDATAVTLLDTAVLRRSGQLDLVAVASDLDRSWTFGHGGPSVTGPATELAWWLTGRGDGAVLTSEGGALPRIGAW